MHYSSGSMLPSALNPPFNPLRSLGHHSGSYIDTTKYGAVVRADRPENIVNRSDDFDPTDLADEELHSRLELTTIMEVLFSL